MYNMAKVTRLITIETRGPIPQKSGIAGPINQPFREDVRVIARMVMGKIAVREHLENGDTRLLSIRDLPELTAEAPAVLPRHQAIKDEMSRAQKVLKEQKEKELADAKVKVEEKAQAKAEVPAKPEEAPVTPAPESTPEVEPTPDLASMTKAERKAYLQSKANNERKEEVVESK